MASASPKLASSHLEGNTFHQSSNKSKRKTTHPLVSPLNKMLTEHMLNSLQENSKKFLFNNSTPMSITSNTTCYDKVKSDNSSSASTVTNSTPTDYQYNNSELAVNNNNTINNYNTIKNERLSPNNSNNNSNINHNISNNNHEVQSTASR